MTPQAGRSRRLLAIIAGLVTVVVGLSVAVVDLSIDRTAIDDERAATERTINQLTKRLYWLEQQLDGDLAVKLK